MSNAGPEELGSAVVNRAGSLLKNLLLVLVSLLVVIASLEVALRLYAGYDVRVHRQPQAGAGKNRCDPVFVHDNVLGWRLVENCTVVQEERRGHEYAVTTHTNNHGFRDNKDYRYAKREQVKRVVLIGDSFSFGNGVEEPGRASNLLEVLFGGAIEVYNLAISNYGLDQAFLMLGERGFAYQPDLVLVGFSDPMFERLSRGVTASGWSKPFLKILDGELQLNLQPDEAILAPKSLLERSYLWELIKMRVSALPPNRAARDAIGAELTEKILAEIAVASKSHGAQLVVFSINPKYILDRPSDGPPALNRLIDKLAKRYGFYFLDLYPSFRGADYARFFYPIDGHYNLEGHMHVAQELCLGLRSLGLLAPGNDRPCRLDRAKIYAAIDSMRRCDFDGSGNDLALGGKCLPLQCTPVESSEVCEIPGGKTGRRRCEEFQTWGARWSKCQ
jgi:hypothetical protein